MAPRIRDTSSWKWEKKDIIRLIKAIKEAPSLWSHLYRHSTIDFKETQKQKDVMLKILCELNIPGLKLIDVQKKITFILSGYYQKRELVLRHQMGGSSRTNRYKPQAFWYKEANKILRKHFDPLIKSIITKKSGADSTAVHSTRRTYTSGIKLSSNLCSSEEFSKEFYNKIWEEYNKEFPRKGLLRGCLNTYERSKKEVDTENEETEFDLFGKSIASLLREMPIQEALVLQQELKDIVDDHKSDVAKSSSNADVASVGVSLSSDDVEHEVRKEDETAV